MPRLSLLPQESCPSPSAASPPHGGSHCSFRRVCWSRTQLLGAKSSKGPTSCSPAPSKAEEPTSNLKSRLTTALGSRYCTEYLAHGTPCTPAPRKRPGLRGVFAPWTTWLAFPRWKRDGPRGHGSPHPLPAAPARGSVRGALTARRRNPR